MEIKVKGEASTWSSEGSPVSAALDYFYIIFNYGLEQTGIPEEGSLVFFIFFYAKFLSLTHTPYLAEL